MDSQDFLPNTDPDLKLAQEIGEVLENRGSLKDLNNPLIQSLLEFKNTELSSMSVESINRDKIWESINAETKPKAATITPLFQRTNFRVWASAAVILIAAFLSFYWIQLPQDLELVASATDSIETIILEDGSEITLRPNSSLYKQTREKNRAYTLEGEAFFNIVSNPNNVFSLNASDGVITVLGTKFNVSTWGEKVQVYLEEGSVKFESSINDESIILEPGQTSTLDGGELAFDENVNLDIYLDWISNTIVFQNSDPLNVVQELSQHYDVTISIENLENRSGIDGTLRLESIEQTLDNLALVLGGTFRSINQNEYEFVSME